MAIAVLVAVAAPTTGCSRDLAATRCTASPACEGAGVVAEVTAGGLRFTLPPELQFRTDGFLSSGEAFDSFYGTVALGAACSPGCGLASFAPLSPGAVVVGIGTRSGLGAGGSLDGNVAPNTSVAGRLAFASTELPGTCGGDETVEVRIPDPASNEVVMRACLYGPDLTAGERILDALLASATPATG